MLIIQQWSMNLECADSQFLQPCGETCHLALGLLVFCEEITLSACLITNLNTLDAANTRYPKMCCNECQVHKTDDNDDNNHNDRMVKTVPKLLALAASE